MAGSSSSFQSSPGDINVGDPAVTRLQPRLRPLFRQELARSRSFVKYPDVVRPEDLVHSKLHAHVYMKGHYSNSVLGSARAPSGAIEHDIDITRSGALSLHGSDFLGDRPHTRKPMKSVRSHGEYRQASFVDPIDTNLMEFLKGWLVGVLHSGLKFRDVISESNVMSISIAAGQINNPVGFPCLLRVCAKCNLAILSQQVREYSRRRKLWGLGFLIRILLNGELPIPRDLPMPDVVLQMNKNLYWFSGPSHSIRISGSLQPFLIFYNVQTSRAIPIQDLSDIYGIHIYGLLWCDKNHSQITFSQHPAYIDVDRASVFCSFINAPNFDVERSSILDPNSKPAFILIVRLTPHPPTLRVIKKRPCELLDWNRIDHLVCMGYREYLWVVHSPADANTCLYYILRTWIRGDFLLQPHLFSQEQFERNSRLELNCEDWEGFPGTHRPWASPSSSTFFVSQPTSEDVGASLTFPSSSFHIPEFEKTEIEDRLGFGVSIDNEEFPNDSESSTVPEDWPKLHKLELLEKLEKKGEDFSIHEESHHPPQNTRVLEGLKSSVAEENSSPSMNQSDRNIFQTLFSGLVLSQSGNHALKDIICSHAKNLFVRGLYLTKGTRRLVWTCKCGHTAHDDFSELSGQEGAIVEFAKEMMQAGYITHAQITSQSLGPIDRVLRKLQNTLTALTFVSLGSSQTRAFLPTSVKSGSPAPSACLPIEQCRWLHLCIKKRPYSTHLKAMHVCQDEKQDPLTDITFFKALKRAYLKERAWKDWLILKLKRIEFIGFEACPGDFVDHIKPNDLPPTTIEYDFTPPPPPKMVPPIGPDHMLHLFQSCPSISQIDSDFYLRRIPRRKIEPIVFKSHSLDDNLGWGLHFVEGINTALAITVMFTMSSILGIVFAICWTIFERDIQGAFGVAAYITSVITLAAMTWQMWTL